MNCPICGKPTLMSAKLCGPCRAALKRARDDTVFELPGAAPTRREGSEARSAGRTRAIRRTLAVAALGLAAFGAAAVHLAGRDAGAAAPAAVAAPASPRPYDGTAPVPAAAPVLSTSAAAPVTPALDLPPQPVTQPSRPHEPVAPRMPKAVVAPIDAMPPAPLPATLPIPAARALVAAVSAAADPWQAMDAALARCAGEGLFARLGCEQRVRTKYCDGHWGEAPQCPGGVANDHGQ